MYTKRLKQECTERHFYIRIISHLKFFNIQNGLTIERIKIFRCFFKWSCKHLI